MKVDLFASSARPHYFRHAEAVYAALPDHLRGSMHRGNTVIADNDDPILLAGYHDLQLLRQPRRRPILVEHGAGQTYLGLDHGSYSGGPGRDRVGLFLCPNEAVAERNRARYPHAASVAVGCPALDRHADTRPPDGPPVVALTLHFDPIAQHPPPEMRSALPHYEQALPAIVTELRDLGCEVVGHGHPRWGAAARTWKRLGVPHEPDWDRLLRRLAVVVVDNSSVGFEAAALGRGVVWLNAPWYRRDVEHGLRFWSAVGVGWQADGPGEVAAAVERALAGPPAGADTLAAEVLPWVGSSAQRAAAAVVAWIEGEALAEAS